MLNLAEDIHSLTDFKRHTTSFLKQIKHRHRPIVLTVNGKAELIVQDAKSYQRLLALADRFESVSALREGLAQAKRNEGISLDKFEKHVRKKQV